MTPCWSGSIGWDPLELIQAWGCRDMFVPYCHHFKYQQTEKVRNEETEIAAKLFFIQWAACITLWRPAGSLVQTNSLTHLQHSVKHKGFMVCKQFSKPWEAVPVPMNIPPTPRGAGGCQMLRLTWGIPSPWEHQAGCNAQRCTASHWFLDLLWWIKSHS